MLNVLVNGDRAGRVSKPARSLEISDPMTGEILGHISFSSYGHRGDPQHEIQVTIKDEKTKLIVRLENKAVPELITSYHGGGGWWRWDPLVKEEKRINILHDTINKICRVPVEIVRTETRIQPAEEY